MFEYVFDYVMTTLCLTWQCHSLLYNIVIEKNTLDLFILKKKYLRTYNVLLSRYFKIIKKSAQGVDAFSYRAVHENMHSFV